MSSYDFMVCCALVSVFISQRVETKGSRYIVRWRPGGGAFKPEIFCPIAGHLWMATRVTCGGAVV